jgi:hypothetical protein
MRPIQLNEVTLCAVDLITVAMRQPKVDTNLAEIGTQALVERHPVLRQEPVEDEYLLHGHFL